MTPAPPDRTQSDAAPTPLGLFLVSLAVTEMFSGVLQTYFTPLAATLAERFGVGVGTLSWGLTGFLLATAVSTPLFARLGDVYGHRRILLLELAVVTIGSVLVALAPNFTVLIIGRVLQGAYGAFLPLMFGLVRGRYSMSDTRRAIAYLSSVLIFGVLAGLIGIALIVRYTDGSGWALWLPAGGMILSLLACLVTGAIGRNHTPHVRPPEMRVDWVGAILLAIGLGASLLGISEGASWGWTSAAVLVSIIGGVVALVVWAQVEHRVRHPLADLRHLLAPRLLPVYGIGFAIYFALNGGQIVGGTFAAAPRRLLGYGFGQDPFHLSMWGALAFGFTFLAVLSTARLGRLVGYHTLLLAGTLCATVGYALLTVDHSALSTYLILTGVSSLGIGFIESSTRTVIVENLRDGEVAIGAGIYELAITLGAAVCLAARVLR